MQTSFVLMPTNTIFVQLLSIYFLSYFSVCLCKHITIVDCVAGATQQSALNENVLDTLCALLQSDMNDVDNDNKTHTPRRMMFT